jgi:hypothetical protein
MDQILLMVLTVAANALVTGIIVFIFQKRMESSIIRKNYEHQVKFAKFYNKSLEVIDTLRQKIILYRISVLEANIEISSILFDWGERRNNKWYEGWVTDERKREVHTVLQDLIRYKDDNVIYIPDKYLSEISETIKQVSLFFNPIFGTEISTIVRDEKYLKPYQVGYLSTLMKVANVKKEEIGEFEGGRTAIDIVKKLGDKFEKICKRYEEIYKEIADIPSGN